MKQLFIKNFFKFFSLLILLAPAFVFAQYQPLVGIPGIGQNTGNFDAYLQAIYATSISLAALLAVIKIVIAGVKWMTTDIVTSKGDAKKDIEGAILGLVVILAAVLILYIINPNIGAVSLELNKPPAPAPSTEGTDSSANIPKDIAQGCLELDLAEGELCKSKSCEYFATDYWVTTLVNDPLNRALCASLCSGTVVGRDLTHTGTCVYSSENEAIKEAKLNEALDKIAVDTCPEGNTCRAETCDRSNTNYCRTKCINVKNGIEYNKEFNACIYTNETLPVSVDVTTDSNTTYTIKQNEDALAAGDEPVEILIVSDTAENGYVEVIKPDGSETSMSCSYIVPNPCEPLDSEG